MSNSKQDAITNCIRSIAIINSIDCTPREAKEALKITLDHLLDFPGINQLKRTVLKTANTADRNAVKIERLLRLCLNDSTPSIERENALQLINSSLYEALHYLKTAF